MKKLTEENRTDLVKYRIERAYSTLEEVDILFGTEKYNAALSRLYYACFYSVLALLLSHGIEAKTHEGVKRMFGLNFVSKGLVDNALNVHYAQIYNARIQCDYDDYLNFDKETAKTYISNGKNFIKTIEELISQQQ